MKLLEHQPELDALGISMPGEALFREAKRRERHRRIGFALSVILVLGAIAAIVGLVGNGGRNDASTTSAVTTPGAPAVNAKAFAHEGDLAFVSKGDLWVLTGSARLQKITVAKGSVPSSPAFSTDGRWMSFVTSKVAGGGIVTQLWIAHADGSDAHQISGLSNPVVIGWSPRSDVLAVTNQGVVKAPQGSFSFQTSVWLISPSGARRQLAVAEGIEGGAWSPDGSQLAIAIDSGGIFEGKLNGIIPTFQSYGPWAAKLVAYPVNGGKPTLWFKLNSTTSFGSDNENLVLPVGWWPKWGIGFRTVTLGEYDPILVVNNGVLDLWHVSSPGRPALLGTTLANGTLSNPVASSNGELAITNEPPNVGAVGVGSIPLQGQQVRRCSPTTGTCVNVTEPSGTESLDPVWSPNGSDLAYIVGKEFVEPFSQGVVANWYKSLRLWLYNAKKGTSDDVTSTKGAIAPLWSQDGKNLLYVANDGLWLWKDLKGTPVEVAALGAAGPPSFGGTDWTEQFAWSK